jgi:glycosyltransferase involved in cell wall biosynthesis
VIRNAVERDIFSPGDRNEARLGLGLELDRPLVVSIGHLVRRKRHHILIEAFAQVRKLVPDATLAIIGARSFEADYPRLLEEIAQKLGLQNCVRFVGNVPQQQVAQWLRAADVFALLSAREGCCNAILEALAAGAPVVITPTGENSHFVQQGRNGWLVPIDAADAASAAITAALQSRSWNRDEISAGLIAEVGNWKTVATRVLDFFRERLSMDGAGTHVSSS